jgi:large subunit ribosomal protein L4
MPRTKKVETATPRKKTTQKDPMEVAVPVVPSKAEKGVTIEVFDIKGSKTTMTLPQEVFGAKINKSLMAQAVRVYLANQRIGAAKTKTRGEVQGSTRKIYQQKGTGRARHGGIRAPIFVGGGIAHGPRTHDFSLSMPQKMRKQALFSALSSKKATGDIIVVKGLDGISAKTKEMMTVLKTIHMDEKKTNLMLVVPKEVEKITSVMRAARNIAGISLIPVTSLNTYEVVKSKTILFMQEAIQELSKTK